jgi:hypothetical protein
VEVFDLASARVGTVSESESESYITTDSQSASLSWNKAPIWGLRPDICLCSTVLLRETLTDWIKNTYFDTTAASVFGTGETTVKVFIPVVTVYYLRVAA